MENVQEFGYKRPRIRIQRQLKLISLESSFSPSVSQTLRFGFGSKTTPTFGLLTPGLRLGYGMYSFLPAWHRKPRR